MPSRNSAKRTTFISAIVIAIVVVILISPIGRGLPGRFFRSLRMQKVQAVNVDMSAFTDPNANPTLHQMVAQMISDKVNVTVNEPDQPAANAAAASQLAGFHVELLRNRKDSPKLIVAGQHAMDLTVDRARLQAIFSESGHPELAVPPSLNGASVAVQIPRAVQAQYGTCPMPASATSALTDNITGPPAATTAFSDCVRLREGPSPTVNVPPGLDIAHLAEIGLEVAGMSPSQAQDFLQTVDWKSTLTMAVPRFLRSYQELKLNGTQGTLLTMAGRRGPGYSLIWVKNGIGYTLTGFGDSSQAVALADSLQ